MSDLSTQQLLKRALSGIHASQMRSCSTHPNWQNFSNCFFDGELQRIIEELQSRDQSVIGTPKLIELSVRLSAQLQDELPIFLSPVKFEVRTRSNDAVRWHTIG